MITPDNYYSFQAVSNSELSSLQNMWEEESVAWDKQQAYDDGNLVDAIITEPHRVDYFRRTVQGIDRIYTPEKMEMAKQMKKAFYADSFCKGLASQCSFQHITYNPNYRIQHDGWQFELPAKCKWDLFRKDMDMGGDIKSTFATSQKQFIDACHYFDYFRSRAWYMDLEGRTNDILIGISKKTYQVFKIAIRKGDALYNLGRSQYQELAFKYFYLFGDLNTLEKL